MDRKRSGENLPAAGGEAGEADEKRAAMNALPGLAQVPVKLRVILGGTKISFEDAANLTRETLLPIDRAANDPVEVVVNGKLIAKGKLVVIDDTYGVQITVLVGQ